MLSKAFAASMCIGLASTFFVPRAVADVTVKTSIVELSRSASDADPRSQRDYSVSVDDTPVDILAAANESIPRIPATIEVPRDGAPHVIALKELGAFVSREIRYTVIADANFLVVNDPSSPSSCMDYTFRPRTSRTNAGYRIHLSFVSLSGVTCPEAAAAMNLPATVMKIRFDARPASRGLVLYETGAQVFTMPLDRVLSVHYADGEEAQATVKVVTPGYKPCKKHIVFHNDSSGTWIDAEQGEHLPVISDSDNDAPTISCVMRKR